MKPSYSPLLFLAFIFLLSVNCAVAQESSIHVYGPGGPFPAINEAAKVFGAAHDVHIEVTRGPTGKWLNRAKADADIIYSGAEFMLTDFIRALDGQIDESTATPLYLRPSGLLVRPGNPRKIGDFDDILKQGIRILVVSGAGQTALWEDMAGKQGNIETVRELRNNIVYYALNSAEAKKIWLQKDDIDVWLIWNIWQVSNPSIADFVPVSDKYVIYRDCGIALTHKGGRRNIVKEFFDYLQSGEAGEIFRRWGWIAGG